MPATRFLVARPSALNGSSIASRWRAARVWQAQVGTQGKFQRAAYAIPPQDKHNDDLGGPYGQENPNPAERKKVNRSFASQTAIGLALVLGFGVIFSGFASPRKIAQHQIDNDKQIGTFGRSNTGSALAEAKYGKGSVGGHALHAEQTGSK